ncbi:hypothetical protein QBC39DRAFT_385336 [Podospora conica]|nr:hypothetical protein QBC39DRAFT_385336 [Schizothecium conicum]
MNLLLLLLGITLTTLTSAIPLTSPEPANTPSALGLMTYPSCGTWGAACTAATVSSDCCPPDNRALRAICAEDSNTCEYVKRQKDVGGCAQEGFIVSGGICA